MLASGGWDNAIKLWSLPEGILLPVCLLDPASSPPGVTCVTYTINGVAYSLPAGSPIPPGAVCTCNAVQGTWSPGGGGGGGTYYYPN
jgi:hypothetical protein